jgi:hypothetical protein
MPTDLEAAAARKREAEAQAQSKIRTLFWLIFCVGMIGLLFAVFAR